MNRDPMTIYSWFIDGGLAIADTVWVEGIGVCSHQPDLRQPKDNTVYRMMDEQRNILFVTPDKMYDITREESNNYWRAIGSMP